MSLTIGAFLPRSVQKITVDISYNAPDRKEFKVLSESGNKWIVQRVLKRLIETEREAQESANRAALNSTPRNYEFTSLERRASADGCAYVLGVQPKVPNKFLYRGRIWVNDQDFAVCRIEAEPAKNPSIWITKTQIRQNYQKIGDFWLPVEKPERFDFAPRRPRQLGHRVSIL